MSTKRSTENIEREYAKWEANTDALQKAVSISAWVEENDAGPDTRHHLACMTAPELAWLTLIDSLAEDDEDIESIKRAVRAVADERSFYELRRDYDNVSDLEVVHYFYVVRFLVTGSAE